MINRRSFITGIKSVSLSSKEKIFLKTYRPWGIILFSRNIKSIKQIKNLTNEIKKIFKDKNYPILLDQEGGRVNRLHKFLNADTLTSKYFGDLFIKDKKKFNIYFKIFINKTSYLLKQIEIIKPKIIVALGKVAGKSLLNKDLSLKELRSQFHEFNSIPLKVTYHPQALLNEPAFKKNAWEDFQAVRDFINQF